VVWTHLPVLVVLNACVAVAAVPAVALVLVGGYLVAPLVAAFTLGPVWAVTIAMTDQMVRGQSLSWSSHRAVLWRHAMRGVRLGVVAAIASTAFLGTAALLAVNPGARWLLVPLTVDGCVAVILGLAGISAFTLTTTGGLRGWILLRASLEALGANPLPATGTVALLVAVGCLVAWLPSTAVVLPAVVAVYLSAWTLTAVQRA